LEIIKDTVSPEVFATIFEPINAVSLENNMLTLELPSLWYKEILEEQYVDLLRTAIRKLLGNDAKLRYKVLMERGQNPSQNASITISSASRKAVKNPLMMPPLDVNAMDRKDILDRLWCPASRSSAFLPIFPRR
jgi:chromosomal replication initiator protein